MLTIQASFRSRPFPPVLRNLRVVVRDMNDSPRQFHKD